MERIGRYVVDRLLARGGMAEVFVARAEGPAGFSKSVVIKRILPELAQDPNFVQMFLNEARLAAQLNHPNIVQVFDFGEHEGQYYLAMEYIEGESLRSILRAHQSRKERMEPRLAAKLISGICEGLHYAHQLCDENGASFNIVHRDVSPENILVSTSGIPKVLDFGIAKAASTTTRTEAGTVKGKYAYMCPEQIRGEGVDRQLDVYALGITLYEMLVGRRPFVAESELALLNQILKGNATPVDGENPKVSPDLSAIVATAMANDKEERYPDCRSLQAALEDFLSSAGMRASWVELGPLVEEAARNRKGKENDLKSSGPKGVPGFPVGGAALGSERASGPRSGLDTAPAPTGTVPTVASQSIPTKTVPAPVGAMGLTLAAAQTAQEPRLTFDVDDAAHDTGVAALVQRESGRRNLKLLLGLGLGALVGTVAVLVLRGPSTPEAPVEKVSAQKPVEPVPQVVPAPVVPSQPSTAPAPGATAADKPGPNPVATLDPEVAPGPADVAAPQLLVDPPQTLRPGTAASRPAAPEVAPPARGDGFLTVRSDPWCDVYLDGQRLGTTPLNREPVAAGRHTLELRNDAAGALRKSTVVISADSEAKESVVFGQGTLYVEAAAATEVFVNGRPVGKTPMDPVALVEGTYSLKLVNRALAKEETRSVKVRAGVRQLVQVEWN